MLLVTFWGKANVFFYHKGVKSKEFSEGIKTSRRTSLAVRQFNNKKCTAPSLAPSRWAYTCAFTVTFKVGIYLRLYYHLQGGHIPAPLLSPSRWAYTYTIINNTTLAHLFYYFLPSLQRGSPSVKEPQVTIDLIVGGIRYSNSSHRRLVHIQFQKTKNHLLSCTSNHLP